MATDPGMADVVISPGPETFPVDTTPDEQVKPPYNRGFLRSSYNWVKLTEILFDTVTLICTLAWSSNATGTGAGWGIFVCLLTLLTTCDIYIFYLFDIKQDLEQWMSNRCPWDLAECTYCAISMILYFITGIIAACYGNRHSAVVASAVFCFLTWAVYLGDTILCFQRFKLQQTELMNRDTSGFDNPNALPPSVPSQPQTHVNTAYRPPPPVPAVPDTTGPATLPPSDHRTGQSPGGSTYASQPGQYTAQSPGVPTYAVPQYGDQHGQKAPNLHYNTGHSTGQPYTAPAPPQGPANPSHPQQAPAYPTPANTTSSGQGGSSPAEVDVIVTNS